MSSKSPRTYSSVPAQDAQSHALSDASTEAQARGGDSSASLNQSGDYVHITVPASELARLQDEGRPLLFTGEPGRPRNRRRVVAALADEHPLSDCSTRALVPIMMLVMVIVCLAGIMLVYPRLLRIDVIDVQLDPNSTVPVRFHLSPPSVTFDLVSDVVIANPLFSDLHNMNLTILAYYPHFEPAILIGHSKMNARVELASGSSTPIRVPFQLQFPHDAPQPELSAADLDSPPSLSDVVVALMDDCKTKGHILLNLELLTEAQTWWWHFGGTRQDFRDLLVECTSHHNQV
ncbi:hypothetical protein RI367_001166 [Sorochytrium milnesiophthora]